MKNATIDTAAAWAATLTTFQDGDIFREANVDTMTDSICDRLGYLKTKADAAAYLASDQTFAGVCTFSDDVTFGGTSAFTGNSTFSGNITVTGDFSTGGTCTALAGIILPGTVASNADSTLDPETYQWFRIPTITANRVYTLSNPTNNGQSVTLTRVGTEAFTATIKRADATTLAVIASGQPASVTMRSINSKWVVESWTANVSSIHTDVF